MFLQVNSAKRKPGDKPGKPSLAASVEETVPVLTLQRKRSGSRSNYNCCPSPAPGKTRGRSNSKSDEAKKAGTSVNGKRPEEEFPAVRNQGLFPGPRNQSLGRGETPSSRSQSGLGRSETTRKSAPALEVKTSRRLIERSERRALRESCDKRTAGKETKIPEPARTKPSDNASARIKPNEEKRVGRSSDVSVESRVKPNERLAGSDVSDELGRDGKGRRKGDGGSSGILLPEISIEPPHPRLQSEELQSSPETRPPSGKSPKRFDRGYCNN